MRLLTEEIIRDEQLTSVQIARRTEFPPLPLLRDDTVAETEPDQSTLTDRYTDEAIAFMRENRERPFFLFMSHMYVHLPLYAPAEYVERSENGRYGAVVEHLDHCTGRLLDELRALQIQEDTLVIFTSDNGSTGRHGGSNGPLRGRKGTTWEGGIREPCIMSRPGHIPPGSVCSALATMMDLMPTVAGLAGGSTPADRIIDGRDISGLISGREPGHPHEAFFYYSGPRLEAVRAGRWKLFLNRNELYDLEADVGETENLFAGHPRMVRQLMARADVCREDLGDELTGKRGRNCRPVGRIADPRTLTRLERSSRFVRAAYD
jgi:arylsulfatase A-like enzyme